jgi:hypothetical protein
LDSNNQTSTGNEESSRMIERIKQIIPSQNKEDVKIVEEPENLDTPFYTNKYVIVTSIIIISSLS